MRQLRVGVVGQSLDAVLLTQSFEQLFGVEVGPDRVPGGPAGRHSDAAGVTPRRDRRLCALVEADLSDSEGLGRGPARPGGDSARDGARLGGQPPRRAHAAPRPAVDPHHALAICAGPAVGARYSLGRCAWRPGVVPGHHARSGSILKPDILSRWKRRFPPLRSSCIRVG